MSKHDNEVLYKTIFKRKSFHLFNDINEKLTEEDFKYIKTTIDSLEPLYPDIKTEFVIAPAKDASGKRYEEYCILMYSEERPGYLQNIGYMGEQLDLCLQSKNIASLWCGLSHPLKKHSDLSYVIMIAINKCTDLSKYRKDMYKAKRKEIEEIWHNEYYKEIGNIVRFSPSACNSQPWIIEGNEKEIVVNRYTKAGLSGMMPEFKAHYFNAIDIGIFMEILEVVLTKNNIQFAREDILEDEPIDRKYLNAIYKIK